jgi:DNA-binding transcriptional ArsR family regulator
LSNHCFCLIIKEMSKNSRNLPDRELPAAESNVSQLQPPVVLAALGSPVRWAIVHLLADGRPRTITEIAAVVGGLPDTVSKHLWLLRRAGLGQGP